MEPLLKQSEKPATKSQIGKSLTELRTQALALGVKFTFADDAGHLRQKIDQAKVKQTEKMEREAIVITVPSATDRLTPDEIRGLLAPVLERGLHLEFTDNGWIMRYGKKMDSGSLAMPAKHIADCAVRMIR